MRHEGGNGAPGLDTAVRLAEVLNVTVDYLGIANAPRRPPERPQQPTRRLRHLEPDHQAALLRVLDAFITKTKLHANTSGVG